MRTKWIPKAQWYGDYVAMNDSNRVKAWQIDKVISKAQKGDKLGKAENRFMQWLYEYTKEQAEWNKAEAAAVELLPIDIQRMLPGVKKVFIEHIGDAGNEVIADMTTEFYAKNPNASVKEHDAFLYKELTDFFGE